MSIDIYIHVEGEDSTELEVSIDELVDVSCEPIMLKTLVLILFYIQQMLMVLLHLSDAKHHASLLSSFSINNSLHFGVNGIISFHELVGKSDKVTIANLGRPHQTSLDSYYKKSQEYSYLFGIISYYGIPSILLKHVLYVLKLVLLMIFLYTLNNTTLRHFSK